MEKQNLETKNMRVSKKEAVSEFFEFVWKTIIEKKKTLNVRV